MTGMLAFKKIKKIMKKGKRKKEKAVMITDENAKIPHISFDH